MGKVLPLRSSIFTLPSSNAFPSQRINYVLFETDDPLADIDLVNRRYPNLLARAAGGAAPTASNQIYMRYLGPKTVP